METDDKQHWMGFNIYAFIRPRTRKEYSALLDEGLAELKNLNRILGETLAACPKARDEKDYLTLMPANPLPLSFWTHGIRPGKPTT